MEPTIGLEPITCRLRKDQPCVCCCEIEGGVQRFRCILACFGKALCSSLCSNLRGDVFARSSALRARLGTSARERDDDRGKGASSQRWATFVRNHADAIVACDFMVAVTAKFRLLYLLIIIELGSRRILQCNVTVHPTAEWRLQ